MGTIQERKWRLLSVVIPTLDAAAHLPALLATLAESGPMSEIVIADGGSGDDTIAIARGAGARITEAPRGRGTQMAEGAAAARGDWLLFLHADCEPEPGWKEGALRFIAAPGAEDHAGYFGLALDDADPAARW